MPHILLELGHPGHVHFFGACLKKMQENDWEVHAFAREKAESFELLRNKHIKTFIERKRNEGLRKIESLPSGVITIAKIVTRLKIDVMIGIHPVYSALASRLTNKPTIAFADTDHALEQMAIYVPNSKRVYTPRSFRRNLGKKQIRYKGFHELAYLRPGDYKPDSAVLDEYGILDQGPPVILRIIDWNATHDFRVRRKLWEPLLIRNLAKEFRLIISSEGKIPKGLEKYENPLPSNEFHNLLAFASIYIGDGATSSSEAAILGTPSIYTNPLDLGYIQELASVYNLVYIKRDPTHILETAKMVLESPKSLYETRRKKLLSNTIDVSDLVVKAIKEEISD